jgi:hypothetical protein
MQPRSSTVDEDLISYGTVQEGGKARRSCSKSFEKPKDVVWNYYKKQSYK